MNATKELFNYCIYPVLDDHKNAAKSYIDDNYSDFSRTLSTKKWGSWFERNLRAWVRESLNIKYKAKRIDFTLFKIFKIFKIFKRCPESFEL